MAAKLSLPCASVIFAADAEGANDDDVGGYGIIRAEAGADEMEAPVAAGTRPGRTVGRLGGRAWHLNWADRMISNRIAVSRVPGGRLEKPTKEWAD